MGVGLIDKLLIKPRDVGIDAGFTGYLPFVTIEQVVLVAVLERTGFVAPLVGNKTIAKAVFLAVHIKQFHHQTRLVPLLVANVLIEIRIGVMHIIKTRKPQLFVEQRGFHFAAALWCAVAIAQFVTQKAGFQRLVDAKRAELLRKKTFRNAASALFVAERILHVKTQTMHLPIAPLAVKA